MGRPAGSQVRVLHFGDSQVEGDRISDYLRSVLQEKYGGYGPGTSSCLPTKLPTLRNQAIGVKRVELLNLLQPNEMVRKYGILNGLSETNDKDATEYSLQEKCKGCQKCPVR